LVVSRALLSKKNRKKNRRSIQQTMFLNNSTASTRRSILANNENASNHRVKSLGVNGGGINKKTSFEENSVRTPHGKKELGDKGGQTTQRRRRALGDISNRKGGKYAANGDGSGKVVLKPSNNAQGKTNNKVLFPSSSAKNRTQVKFSKTSESKDTVSTKSKLGGGGLKSTSLKPKTRTIEYDDIYGPTTRWAQEVEEDRSPYETVPKEELDAMDDLFASLEERSRKESEELDKTERQELEMDEERSAHLLRLSDDGLGAGFDSCAILDDDPLSEQLEEKLPWEEEAFDPAEERRLSGSDPFTLWGDISCF